jgi:predicted TIM-barrel enzyme
MTHVHLNQDGIIVENMHDIPYVKGTVGSEIIAAMTRICSDVKKILPNIPCGLQVYIKIM